MPLQARSKVTVDAIHDATIQVLRKTGEHGLTTTQVAERAGVSVGTLYQYFPHKQALMFAALERHMNALAVALEDMCQRNRGNGIDVIAQELAIGYINLKIARAKDRSLFYAVVTGLKMDRKRRSISARIDLAVAGLLLSAADAQFDDAFETAAILMRGMRIVMRAAIEYPQNLPPVDSLHSELSLFARNYLRSSAHGSRQLRC